MGRRQWVGGAGNGGGVTQTSRADGGQSGAPRPQAGAELDLRVGPVAAGGWCVARYPQAATDTAPRELVVFVRHTLPGERVRARVTGSAASFLRADAIEIIEPSKDRVTPPCPYAGPGRCGGCDWQHATPAAQRALKAAVVAEALQRGAGIEWDVTVEELPGTPDGLGWRTRVQYAVDDAGRAGLRRHRSHEVEPIERCSIAHPEVNRLDVPAHRWPAARTVEAISGERDRAVLITPSRPGRFGVPKLAASSALLRRDRSGRIERVRGRSAVRERAAGRQWRVSAGAFWQVHPAAADVLTEAVTAFLRPSPGERVLDLYCGVGLFAGALAGAVTERGTVVGVESDAAAVRDARHNLRDLPQVSIERTNVTRGLDRAGPADLVVLDPPRSGAGRAVVESIAAARPRRVCYVSCDPATLARDLAYFAERGYGQTGLRAFDAFPMTHHVECVALLEPETA